MKIWENLGDVNFFAYGGCLVSKHFDDSEIENNPELGMVFDVFYLNPEYGENGDENFAAMCIVDLTDNWLDFDGMLYTCGLEEHSGKTLQELLKDLSPELLAKEMVEYHGVQEFSPYVAKDSFVNNYPSSKEDFIITDEELNNWLKDMGAEEHCVYLEQEKE